MDDNSIRITHANEEDYETFRKSIDEYDNPTYAYHGRVDSRTDSDGKVETILDRESIKDFERLGEDVKLTGGKIDIVP